MVPLGGFCRCCQMRVAISLKLYVYRPRSAVTQVQISLGCKQKEGEIWRLRLPCWLDELRRLCL